MGWSNLKRPTTSKTRHETTLTDLQRARNELKRPTTSKKRPETTWNYLEWVRNDLKRPIASKKWPQTNCKEQILTSWKLSTWKIIKWRAPLSQRSNISVPCLQYFVFAIFCIICAYRKWWQTEKSKPMSVQNKAKWKNIWLGDCSYLAGLGE